MRIERCHGPATIVPVRPEPQNLEQNPWNVEVGGGLVTWDTGHPSGEFDAELVAGPSARGDLSHATLSSYRLKTQQLRSWRLPPRRLALLGREKNEWPVGVFGYSAHTRFAVFWLAAQDLSCQNEKGLCGGTEMSPFTRRGSSDAPHPSCAARPGASAVHRPPPA